MPMRSAASRIEPVSPMRASRSTLPGPSAISSPHRTRIRGLNRGARDGLAFMLRPDCNYRQPLCQRICSEAQFTWDHEGEIALRYQGTWNGAFLILILIRLR